MPSIEQDPISPRFPNIEIGSTSVEELRNDSSDTIESVFLRGIVDIQYVKGVAVGYVGDEARYTPLLRPILVIDSHAPADAGIVAERELMAFSKRVFENSSIYTTPIVAMSFEEAVTTLLHPIIDEGTDGPLSKDIEDAVIFPTYTLIGKFEG